MHFLGCHAAVKTLSPPALHKMTGEDTHAVLHLHFSVGVVLHVDYAAGAGITFSEVPPVQYEVPIPMAVRKFICR
jgi:hypothetical protein